MTIGKRKGATAKGAGKTTGENFGGSLSRNDHFYLQQAFGMVFDPGTAFQESMEASGGTVNEYTSPDGSVYRSHTYTTSGTFTCTSLGTNIPGGYADKVDVLLVAGGGGGGGGLYHGSGGGAGAYLEGSVYVTGSTNYTITIGGGGNGGSKSESGQPGNTTTFLDPNGGPYTYTANGGAGGVQTPNGQGVNGQAGGSGSGASGWSQPGGSGTGGGSNQPASSVGPKGTLTAYANAGGTTTYAGPPNYIAGGGGGAGGAGGNGSGALASPFVWSQGGTGMGGSGKANTFRYGPATPITYAGGGGGAGYNVSNPIGAGGLGGPGGGGDSKGANPTGSTALTVMGEAGTGGGGGGCERDPINGDGWKEHGGHGGSGIAIVRYKIATTDATSAKATGGNISFWPNANGSPSPTGTTIHYFTKSGTWVNTSGGPISTQVFMVGGGGGGGGGNGGSGGGGSGGGAFYPNFNLGTNPYTITIGAGGQAGNKGNNSGFLGGDTTIATSGQPTMIAKGGGYGGVHPAVAGGAGGSGGGGGPGAVGGTSNQSSSNPGPSSSYGQSGSGGGPGSGPTKYCGGGGGGLTSEGGTANVYQPTGFPKNGGNGMQVPTHFRDPAQRFGVTSPADPTSHYWVGGGGSGGGETASPTAGKPMYGGGVGGGGYGGGDADPTNIRPAWYDLGGGATPTIDDGGTGLENTGGGGGGGYWASGDGGQGGQGGSGVVLICYDT